MEKIRLNKYIASKGFCSRREADNLIEDGLVLINGKKAQKGEKVCETDKVEILISDNDYQNEKKYIMLNKPVGYVCSNSEKEGIPAIRLVKEDDISPIGRLDKDSNGLLLFTNDGAFARAIIGEESECEKEYIVVVDKPISEGMLNMMKSGMVIKGVKTKAPVIKKISESSFNIILVEGRNRQIRRMCRNVGLGVISLKRIRIGNIKLGDLQDGKTRKLTEKEIATLR